MYLSKKRGNIIMENLVFIILNLVFFGIIILFVATKMSSPFVMEEKYSKSLALMIDASKPGMLITIDFSDAIAQAKKNGISKEAIVHITGNVVNVNVVGKNGYSYSFFNDVLVNSYFDEDKLVLFIEKNGKISSFVSEEGGIQNG